MGIRESASRAMNAWGIYVLAAAFVVGLFAFVVIDDKPEAATISDGKHCELLCRPFAGAMYLQPDVESSKCRVCQCRDSTRAFRLCDGREWLSAQDQSGAPPSPRPPVARSQQPPPPPEVEE